MEECPFHSSCSANICWERGQHIFDNAGRTYGPVLLKAAGRSQRWGNFRGQTPYSMMLKINPNIAHQWKLPHFLFS